MTVVLRRADSNDIDALHNIETQAFDVTQYDLTSKRQFRYLVLQGNSEIWLACEQNKALGYITLLYKKNSCFGRLYSIAVLPEYQGKSVGKALFEQAEKAVLQKNAKGMTLEIREDNVRSFNRYQDLGYIVTGRVQDYYPDHSACIKMKKVLR